MVSPFGSMRLAALCLVVLTTSGCASSYRAPQTVPAGVRGKPEAEPEVTRMANLYVLGFFGSARTDVRDMCKSGVAERIAIRTTWLTSLATVATLGLYSPLELG